jgi:hypothetical protein
VSGFLGDVPVHPLVVHAVVVLLPLSALGVLLLALVPRLRPPFAPLVLTLTVISVALVPVASQSGELLQEVVPADEALERHTEFGELVIWAALPLLLAALLEWWLARRERADRAVSRAAAWATGLLAVVASLAVLGLVVLVGHSGAESVWGG